MRAVLLAVAAAVAHGATLSVKMGAKETAGFSLLVDGTAWLESNDVSIFAGGSLLRASDGSLKLDGVESGSGVDEYGMYDATAWNFTASALMGTFSVQLRDYTGSGKPIVVARQLFSAQEDKVGGTDSDSTCTSFPNFLWPGSGPDANLGYLTFAGNMACPGASRVCTVTGTFSDVSLSLAPAGVAAGGPMVLFDNSTQQRTMVVSSAANFFPSSYTFDSTSKEWRNGFLGSLDGVPAGLSTEYIVVVGSEGGVNNGVKQWGWELRKRYGKTQDPHDVDESTTQLLYYTDNGAWSYYAHAGYSDYDTMLTAVRESWESSGLPLRGYQIDSWWYPKDTSHGGNGCVEWVATNDTFPHGLVSFFNENKLPMTAHARYWAESVVYSKENGGGYNFVCDSNNSGFCIPDDSTFWRDLARNSTAWGLRTMEHDWLDDTTQHVTQLLTDATLGRRWLMDMSEGCEENRVTVQLCMAFPRHKMQSLEMAAVTNTRSSDDYHPSNDQWSLGVSCMLDDALGMACWKDVMWSTSDKEPGNKWGNDTMEVAPGLELIVSVLSQGAVGPGDAPGQQNVTRLRRSCRNDGTLLHASAPATAIDATFTQRAFGTGGPQGELWSTYTLLSSYLFPTILGAWLDVPFEVYPTHTKSPPSLRNLHASTSYVAFRDVGEGATIEVQDEWDGSHPITLPKQNKTDPQLWHAAPKWNGVALIGDTRKVVPVSPQRFQELNVDPSTGAFSVSVLGFQGEGIPVSVFDNGVIHTIACNFEYTNSITLSYPAKTCE